MEAVKKKVKMLVLVFYIFERLIGENLLHRPDEIYHVTVMPCYDKKLEAARDDFVSEVESKEESNESGIRITEVDSVLTSGEVLDLIKVRLICSIIVIFRTC